MAERIPAKGRGKRRSAATRVRAKAEKDQAAVTIRAAARAAFASLPTWVRGYLYIVAPLFFAAAGTFMASTYPSAAPSKSVLAWLYLSALCVFFWGSIFLLLIPQAVAGAIAGIMTARGPVGRTFYTLAVAILLVAYPVIHAPRHGWRVEKTFDDVMAISNTNVLIGNSFNIDMLYFRSFLRVGFVAATLPIVKLSPATLETVTKSPSDNYRRVWRIYQDRPGQPVTKNFPAVSHACLFLTVLLPAVGMRIFQLLGARFLLAVAGGALGLYFYNRSIEVIVTQSFTYFTGVWLALLYLLVPEQRKRTWMFIGLGVAAAFAGLTMDTLAIIATAIAIYQVMWWWYNGRSFVYARSCTIMWGTAAFTILVWYQGFLRGLFFERQLFAREVLETQQLMKFPPLSMSEFWRIATLIFGYAAWAVPFTIIALTFARRGFAGKPLMIPWLVLSLGVLATMPFIFSRFMMYAIVPCTWLIVETLELAANAVQTRMRRVPV